jgi:hypothetical protein
MKGALLSLTVALCSCATGPSQTIPLRTIPAIDAPVRSVQLRVVDRRLTRIHRTTRAEAVVRGDMVEVVRNRIEDELARRSIKVSSSEGPEVLVEILDFAWGWQQTSFMVSTSAGAFRMQVTEGAKTERFVGERSETGPSAYSLETVADQLELALDDAIKAMGESTVLIP